MKRTVIYFFDEQDASRRSNARELKSLIDDPSIHVEALEPYPAFADYARLIADPKTAAFILDQRMKGSGAVAYNGTDLASYIRGIDGKIPIYILTSYADSSEDFDGWRHLVDDILAKSSIEDKGSDTAKIIKARLRRHLQVFNDVRDDQEQRFHDLLVISLKRPLTDEEQIEMDNLEGETTAPLLATERSKARELENNIKSLRTLLGANQI